LRHEDLIIVVDMYQRKHEKTARYVRSLQSSNSGGTNLKR